MDNRPPTVELLEARHKFPCAYAFKVIGATGTDLEQRVVECIMAELGTQERPPTSIKEASGGRHESITAEPHCPDAASVIRLYAALRAIDGVLFLF